MVSYLSRAIKFKGISSLILGGMVSHAIFRYQVHEPSEHLDSFDNGIQLGFRPQNPGPYGSNGRPFVPTYQGNNGVLVGPGGPTGIIGR